MREVLSIEDVRLSDEFTIKNLIDEESLIRRVGEKLYLSYDFKSKNTLIIVGKGNNGADGLALALNLKKNNNEVSILLCEDLKRDIPLKLLNECISNSINVYKYNSSFNIIGYDIVVDAIYGIGFDRELSDLYKDIIEIINQSNSYIISIDINSGLNARNGKASFAVTSDLTLAIEFLKPGYFLNDAKDYIKELKVVEVGIKKISSSYNLFEEKDLEEVFKKRKNNSHKGSYGYSALFGGSINYSGAIKLSNLSLSSLIVGSGVSRLIIPEEIKDYVAPYVLESTICPVKSLNGTILYNDLDAKESIKGLSSLGFGMGLKNLDEASKYLEYILKNYEGNLLIDADGLNALANMDLNILNESRANIALSPHIKEFSRLIKKDVKEILDDPIKYALDFTSKYNVSLLLKGTSTIISSKDKLIIVNTGSPSLSKGGSGDILSGIITGIMSYNKDMILSLSSASYIHGALGDEMKMRYGTISSLPRDEIELLKEYISKIEVQK
ncbi:MAG: NAD(P)H-hydrate dehydratase [Gammaproteobacteria bacterium]|nr:NAD(P)H-hydrate dehydratase [Gammaproteobacteria bacterium]